jgi:uncharacterized protein with FMN-binding domain
MVSPVMPPSRLDRGVRRIALCGLGTLGAVVLLFSYRTSTSAALPEAAATPETTGTDAGAVAAAVAPSGGGSARGGWSGTVTGPVVPVKWGQVQVRATLAGGRITAVDVLRHPDENARDRAINAAAVPVLVRETLDAQSSRIDMVSGATYTSAGYVRSLQAALDHAGTA